MSRTLSIGWFKLHFLSAAAAEVLYAYPGAILLEHRKGERRFYLFTAVIAFNMVNEPGECL